MESYVCKNLLCVCFVADAGKLFEMDVELLNRRKHRNLSKSKINIRLAVYDWDFR